MSELTPTRSLLIVLAEERSTMREGYAFLDEKCLLLAGEMLQQVRRQQSLAGQIEAALQAARKALAAALARHGLHGLQVYPRELTARRLQVEFRSLLGVALLQTQAPGAPPPALPAVNRSPEAEACRMAWDRVLELLAELAGLSASLARLHAEYRRTVRRVRALQDVLLPELDADIADIDARLEDIEREDAATVRARRRQS